MLRERGFDPGVTGSARLSQALSVALNELLHECYREAQRHTTPELSHSPLKTTVTRRSLSSIPTLDMSSATLSSRSSSITSTKRELSSPLSRFESQSSQHR